ELLHLGVLGGGLGQLGGLDLEQIAGRRLLDEDRSRSLIGRSGDGGGGVGVRGRGLFRGRRGALGLGLLAAGGERKGGDGRARDHQVTSHGLLLALTDEGSRGSKQAAHASKLTDA